MNILYEEGTRHTNEPGKAWILLEKLDSGFDLTGELYPTYILRWEVSGEPVEGWGEYGREAHRKVAERGRWLLDRDIENDAQAIREAIQQYDGLML